MKQKTSHFDFREWNRQCRESGFVPPSEVAPRDYVSNNWEGLCDPFQEDTASAAHYELRRVFHGKRITGRTM